jgi:putative PIN family toxin of toxin-antitoxin system
LRIVLDTNVALSALLWRGKPYRLLEAIRQRSDIRLFSSPALLAELADVLARPSPTKQLAVISRSAREVLADYLEIVEVVEPEDVPRVVPGDADDDHVIAAAVTARAEIIVSGDSDLLSLGSHQGIDILSAARALEQIGSAEPSSKA